MCYFLRDIPDEPWCDFTREPIGPFEFPEIPYVQEIRRCPVCGKRGARIVIDGAGGIYWHYWRAYAPMRHRRHYCAIAEKAAWEG